jgi:hypothetical protein
MKINTLILRNIIKEELDSFIKEFKMPDIIPTPESMGFERIAIDPSFESKAKEMLSNVDVKGLREFLKQNFPMKALTLKESIEKNLPQRKRAAGEIITENVRIMKADRMWQENFDQNIQELIQISKEDPSQKELIDEWVKIFVFEKSKTWFDKNIPTIEEFVENNYERLKSFIKNNQELIDSFITFLLILGPSIGIIFSPTGSADPEGSLAMSLMFGLPMGYIMALFYEEWIKTREK